ncbi:MAG: radical SAM protein, partial [Candidatus Brocadiales bacterium]|nr:radical SAM protein [Candidatus Brocadiales bacterium]
TTLSPYLHTMNWIGGEPTIQREVRDWVRTYSRINNNIRIVLGTNFANVDHTFINDLARFQSVGLNISLDACEKRLYEELRRNACWEKTYENLRRVIHLRDGGASFGITVSYLWQKRNFMHLPVFLRFCQKHRIKCIVAPLDEYPLPMRIDLYADPAKDLPDGFDDIFEESLREASILDKVTQTSGKYTESYVENSIRVIKKGIARAKRNTYVLRIPMHSVAKGYMAVAENSQGEPLSYSIVSENGTCHLAIPPGEEVRISLSRDIYQACVLWSDLMSEKVSNESIQKEHNLPIKHATGLQIILFKLQVDILLENQYVRGVLNKGILAKYKLREVANILNNLLTTMETESVYHFLNDMSSTSLASLEDIVNACLSAASKEGTQELINRLKALASAIKVIRITRVKSVAVQ